MQRRSILQKSMQRLFVDTNYFLRFLLGDEDTQSEQAKVLLLRGAKGDTELITSSLVFFELCWVFESFYGKSKVEIVSLLDDILLMKFIDIDKREILTSAINLFKRVNLEIEDCYYLIFAKKSGVDRMATFDKKMVKIYNSI